MLAELATLAQDQPAEAGQVAWAAVLGYGGGAITVILGLAELGRRVRRWVREQAEQVTQMSGALATSNGRSLGQLAEHTASKVDQVDERLTAMERMATANQETGAAALALARQGHERLDSHLVGHDKQGGLT